MRFFEDFPVGATGSLGPKRVTKREVLAFAEEFDPQPFHLDEAVANASLLGGLSASGWHTCGMLMRMICDGFMHVTAGMGSPGLEEVRWLKPVRPGDVLTATWRVTEARTSRSRPELGICRIFYEMKNQTGAPVMTWDCIHFFRRRTAEAVPSDAGCGQ
jgi:acyl dehydratase